MVSRREFEKAIAAESAKEDRIVVFGALVAKASGLRGSLVIVGGSAISVYTSGEYISADIDLVGSKSRIVPILERWGFRRDDQGDRPYWTRADLGLVVDLTGRVRYTGHVQGIRIFGTKYGPVSVAAPEDLIVRRLIFSKRGRKEESLNEAVLVFVQAGQGIDLEYVEARVRYEGVEDMYREFRNRAKLVSSPEPDPDLRHG